MKCPNCGHVMNHHADKLLRDEVAPDDDNDRQSVEAYSCPHCGANAAKLTGA